MTRRRSLPAGCSPNWLGSVSFFLCWPLVSKIPGMQNYTALLYAYVIMSILRNLCSQFVRAKQYIRLYAVDGVLNTCLYLFFIILFIAGFHWGIYGYVLATAARIFVRRSFSLPSRGCIGIFGSRGFNGPLLRQMLRYAAPLIPTSMFWWITNTSDHMFITAMIGSEANGLYVAATRCRMSSCSFPPSSPRHGSYPP